SPGLADIDQAVRVADAPRHVIGLALLEIVRPRAEQDFPLSGFGVGHRPLDDHAVVVAAVQMRRADEAFGQPQERAVRALCGVAPYGPEDRKSTRLNSSH